MKVLFIYTNINGFHEDTYSFGLASIISITRQNGHEAKVFIVKNEDEYASIIELVKGYAPDVVGFTTVSSQFAYVKKIATLIKSSNPKIITVCGGVHPTINNECILEAECLDGIFIGESEFSFVEFLKKIETNQSYNNTDNFAYRDNGKVIVNKLKPLLSNLDILPYPDRDVYPFAETVKVMHYAPFLFSRGCPYLCSYCSNHAIGELYKLSRNTPRYRTPESCILELEETLKKFAVDKVIIVDDIFGLNDAWRMEFCEKYRKRVGKKFQCLLRANIITKEFLKKLKYAGCYRIAIGIESGNDYVRNKIMNRGMSSEQIIRAFDLAHKYGMETNAINIIGVPGETEEMIWDTIKINRRVHPQSSGINIFYPYKGTKLGDYCFKEGLVDESIYSSFSNERRATVLNYPEEYKRRLTYYKENWEMLVYPFSLKRRLVKFIKKTTLGGYLKFVKKTIFKV